MDHGTGLDGAPLLVTERYPAPADGVQTTRVARVRSSSPGAVLPGPTFVPRLPTTGGTVMPDLGRSLRRRPAATTRRGEARVSVIVTLVAALVLSACNGLGNGVDVEDDPQGALIDAFDELGGWSGIVIDVRLDADATARAALLDDEELSAEAADTLFASSLRLTASTEDGETGFTLAVVVDDTEITEIRVVGDDRVFIRVDVDRITALADDADVEDFDPDELVLAARMFGAGEAAEALVTGGWVELIGIDDLAELAGGATDGTDDADPAEAEQVDALVDRFAADMIELIEQDAEVDYVGSEDAGERVRITAPTAELAEVVDRFVDELADVTGDVVDEDDPQRLADEVGETVTLDVWLDGGSITQIGFDPATVETAEPVEGEVLVIAAIAEFAGAVEVPSDAVSFDVLQIVGAFFGGFGPGFGPGFDPFDDDAFDDDAFDDAFDDDAVDDDGFEDDAADEPGADCITEQELADLEDVLGPDAVEEIEELIDAGFLERC